MTSKLRGISSFSISIWIFLFPWNCSPDELVKSSIWVSLSFIITLFSGWYCYILCRSWFTSCWMFSFSLISISDICYSFSVCLIKFLSYCLYYLCSKIFCIALSKSINKIMYRFAFCWERGAYHISNGSKHWSNWWGRRPWTFGSCSFASRMTRRTWSKRLSAHNPRYSSPSSSIGFL